MCLAGRELWDLSHGIKRLGYLPALLAGLVLDCVPADLGGDPGVFLQTFRNCAYSNIDAELIEDRMDRWRSLDHTKIQILGSLWHLMSTSGTMRASSGITTSVTARPLDPSSN